MNHDFVKNSNGFRISYTSIENGTFRSQVGIEIEQPCLGYLPGLNLNEQLNNFMNSPKFLVFWRDFKSAWNIINQQYNGFPSALHKARLVLIVFGLFRHAAANRSDNFDEVFLFIPIQAISEIDINTIKHELLHIISAFHHDESKMGNQIKAFHAIYSGSLEKFDEIMESQILSLGNHLQKTGIINAQEFLRDSGLDFFIRFFKENFDNIIADTGLTVLSMELGDVSYAKSVVENDQFRLNRCAVELKRLKIINDILERQNNNPQNLRILEYVQFMVALMNMPFDSAPIAMIENFAHKEVGYFREIEKTGLPQVAARIVSEMYAAVGQYARPAPTVWFHSFYQRYQQCVAGMNIWADPENPEIRRKIFQDEEREIVKRTYKELLMILQKFVERH